MGRHSYSKLCPSNTTGKIYSRAELGAKHDIVFETDPTKPVHPQGLENFFGLLQSALREHVPTKSPTGLSWDLREIPQHRVLDDISVLELVIAERGMIRKFGRKHNVQWTKSQVRRISAGISDAIAQLGIPTNPDGTISVEFTDVASMPSHQQDIRKIAAVVDPQSPVGKFMHTEHDIVIDHLSHYMPGIANVNGFEAALPVATISREVTGKTWDRSLEAAKKLLPIVATVEPITLHSSRITQI